MFTGIIQGQGEIVGLRRSGQECRMEVRPSSLWKISWTGSPSPITAPACPWNGTAVPPSLSMLRARAFPAPPWATCARAIWSIWNGPWPWATAWAGIWSAAMWTAWPRCVPWNRPVLPCAARWPSRRLSRRKSSKRLRHAGRHQPDHQCLRQGFPDRQRHPGHPETHHHAALVPGQPREHGDGPHRQVRAPHHAVPGRRAATPQRSSGINKEFLLQNGFL